MQSIRAITAKNSPEKSREHRAHSDFLQLSSL